MRIGTLTVLCALGALGCDDGHSNVPDRSSAPLGAFPGPQFAGAGTSGAGAAIAAGAPVISCDAPLPLPAGTFGPAPGAQGQMTCFYSGDDPSAPAATMEWIVESAPSGDLVHVRLTLNPAFVDNTYGDNAIGWSSKAAKAPKPGMQGMPGMAMMPGMAGHTFKDLVESDHAEFKLIDGTGRMSMEFDADYLSQDPSAPSGYGTLGVSGGEGKMLLGDANDIVAVSTSLDRDLNTCGFGTFLDSSPATDANYTPNAAAPTWDYRVVYDVWVRKSAFGAAGFGEASVDFVHASPSKASKPSIDVTPGTCPPTWPPYCPSEGGCCEVTDSFGCGTYVPPPKTECTSLVCVGI